MSIVHKFTGDSSGFKWQGVEGAPLAEEGLQSITKHILVGESEGAPNYIMRYFRVEAQGHSRLERHPQEHEVIILHGKGQVQIADQVYEVEPFDVVFVSGNELHQFKNSGDEPFGFICIIPK
jgi:quercetin dioxygenase-like cupin family protein